MIYQDYYKEEFDSRGRLIGAKLHYAPDYNFAYDVIDRLAERVPEKLALWWRDYKGEEVRLRFSDLARLSNQAANVLSSHGLVEGDVLMVSLRSRYEFWYLALAAHKLGVILSPIFHLLSAEDVAYRLEKSQAKAVICLAEDDVVQRVRQGAQEAGLTALYTVGGVAEGFVPFAPLVESASPHLARRESYATEAALLYFTSGSTGRPKGILHDQTFSLSAFLGARYMQDVGETSLHFATGNTAWEVVCGTKFYGPWLCEGSIFVYDYERFSPEEILNTLKEANISSMMAQPSVYRQLLKVGMEELSTVTCFAVGGEKLTPDVAEGVLRLTGQVLYEGYAQSEAGLIAANSKNMGRKEGSVGKILPKYHVEIRLENGRFAEAGQRGEIVLIADGGRRPEGLLMGYFEDDEGAEALWDGNIFHTGDLGYRDEENFLYYLGRYDGLIKTKGYRVSPFDVERILSRHEAVYECLVVGKEDAELGQRIHAYVHLREGYCPSLALREEILSFQKESSTPFQKIRSLEFVGTFCRNANGKIIRNQFNEAERGSAPPIVDIQ